MNDMTKTLKRIGLVLGVFLGIFLLLFMINQFALFYDLLYGIHPHLAVAILAIVIIFLAFFLIRLILFWIKQPKVLTLSENPTQNEYDAYLGSMIYILRRNKHLKNFTWEARQSREEILDQAFQILDEKSFPIIRRTANSVFLSTAISQNGSLDSIFILISAVKLTWRLAKIYETRPSIKSMGKLYLQIASVVFMARSIEDMDLIEDQIEPIIGSLIGESVASAVPGLKPITNLVLSSILEGALNAFLILRVGVIAQSYLGMEVPQTKSKIRKNASLQAASQMGSIFKENTSLIIKSIGNAVKNTGKRKVYDWKAKWS